MALIKCTDCGNMISDKATSCPKCGCPVSYSRKPQNSNIDTRVRHQYGDTQAPYKKNNNTPNWLYAVLAFLLTALLGCAAYYLINKEKGKEGNIPDSEAVNSNHVTTSVNQEPSTPVVPSIPAKQETRPTTAPTIVRNKVDNGTYYLSGVITHKQDYYIDMEVNVNGNQATGRYIVHNGENIYVTLSGTIDSNGNMKLTEYKNGQTTGYYFTGKFDQAIYSGTYRCTNRKLTMQFSVSVY